MSLAQLLTTVTDQIAAALPELRQCEIHPGKFNITELEHFLTVVPAVRVSAVSVRWEPYDEGVVSGHVTMAAFIVTADTLEFSKTIQAINITETIALLIAGNDWELVFCSPGMSVESANLYTTASGDQGVTLWSVSWKQTIHVGSAPQEEGRLEKLYVSQSPKIGLPHEEDYKEVATNA